MGDYTFKGITRVFRDNLSENLLGGTLEFCRWAALNAGGFQNVPLDLSGVYGGNRSQLRCVSDPRYDDGQVWEGFRGDWVWESGVSYNQQPISISGVYVNGTYTNDSSFFIDYPNGRVIFNSGLALSSTIKVEFSHRTVSFVSANDAPISEIFFGSYHTENTAVSGSPLADLRRQLPIVALQINTGRSYEPYQLGGGQWVNTDGFFYVIAEDDFQKTSLVDLISLQNEKAYWIPNFGMMKDSGVYPINLDYRGSLVDTPMQYPEMVESYPWRKVYLHDIQTYNRQNLEYRGGKLYGAIVKGTFMSVMENI